jgi:hypothetical protein
MAISDILTVPFLVSLGITLLIIGVVGMFFVQRLQEQNHKISSMFGLVSSIAEELNYLRSRLRSEPHQFSHDSQSGGVINLDNNASDINMNDFGEPNLIPVSDDENEDDDDSDSEVELDDDSDDDNSEFDREEDSNENNKTIKVINFGELVTAKNELECAEELINNNDYNDGASEDEDLDELNEVDLDADADELDDIEEFDDNDSEDNEADKTLDLESIKKINIDVSNLEDSPNKKSSSIDYKKLSLNKLKEIALSKGLITENSKATKGGILKLLGVE